MFNHLTVSLHYERLSEETPKQELYVGRQWWIHEDGMEDYDRGYYIERRRIKESTYGGNTPSWPRHMAEKPWVDLEDFIVAWSLALNFYGHNVGKRRYRKAVEWAHICRERMNLYDQFQRQKYGKRYTNQFIVRSPKQIDDDMVEFEKWLAERGL